MPRSTSPQVSQDPLSARPAPLPAEPEVSAKNRLVIRLLIVSAFVVILNETITGVAIPRLVQDLGITVSAGQWLSTAFLLTMAVVIPITGFLLQRFNTRPLFMVAMSLFSAGTLLAALAPGFATLVAGRVIQASGTAIMLPLLMTTVMTLVPAASRGRTMGNISIVISVAPAVGPTTAGAILSVLDWRWMFWLVLPIALISLILGATKMTNVTSPHKSAIDVLSVILSALAFGGIVYGFSRLGEASAEALVPAWIPLVVGIIFLALFIVRQIRLQRADRALLDLRTFTSRNFTLAILTTFLAFMALFGTIILLPIYVQSVLGESPLVAGLLLLPGGVLIGVLGPWTGRVFDRRGPRLLLVPGALLIGISFVALSFASETTPIYLVLIAHIVWSLGLALMLTPLLTSALGSVKPNLYSHASAVFGTVQQIAGAVGTALFISVTTIVAGNLAAAGQSETAALAGGIQVAFIWGAVISLAAVIAAIFVRKPDNAPDPSAVPAH
ncbi:multidrug efflux MFS transporter [Arthrobacter sp. MSA 4-2]|uniref:MDR family MFS transporter n=1 Tax=Arthrobacter sp. MSA 4-2 TaxID=2794349 RepID=UPI0018E822FA|nr:multidrug efflux MFS transporter [Arthrobacter sp. MSA 4-2]